MDIRVGSGFNARVLVDGQALVVGGVTIPFARGLESDVVLHAIGDALLGALALGDLAAHFPGDDPRWKGTDSRARLRHALALVQGKGYGVVNIDATVIGSTSLLAPFVGRMRDSIAFDLGCDTERVSVKAGTGHLTSMPGEEGMAAMASVLVARFPTSQN